MQQTFIKRPSQGLLLVIFTLLVGPVFGQAFQLNGTTKNMEGKWIYFYYSNADNARISDSAQIKDNVFHFSGTVAGASMVYLGIKGDNGRLNQQDSYHFFIEPGSITLNQTGEHLSSSLVRGSKTQTQYQQLADQQTQLSERWQVVMDTLSSVNQRSNTEYQKLKDWVLTPYRLAMDEFQIAFMNAHPQSAATAYLLRFFVSEMSLDTLQKYYDALGPQMQASIGGQDLAKEIAQIRKGSPGSMATDFQAKGLQGETVQLSAFKGKYVLLDFWASWCVPCRASNPHLKELYQANHDKGLEIIGVSDDDGAPDKWRAAVAKDGIGIWHNVLRGYDRSLAPGSENPKDISGKFGIHVLPTKILIGPDGKIIGRYSGTEDELLLDKALEKAFGAS